MNSKKTTSIRRYDSAWGFIARVSDVTVISVSAALAYFLRFDSGELPDMYQIAIAFNIVISLFTFPALWIYDSWRIKSLWILSTRVLGAWSASFVLLMVLMVMTHRSEHFARAWLAYWFITGGAGLLLARLASYRALRILRCRKRNLKSIAIVGCGELARNLASRINECRWMGIRVAAMFCLNDNAAAGEHPQHPLHELQEWAAQRKVDEVWVALPLEQGSHVTQVMQMVKNTTVGVRYFPDLFGIFLLNHGVTQIAGMPMIDLTTSPIRGVNHLVKSVEDRMLAALILLVATPAYGADLDRDQTHLARARLV
jgi:putative colanic acid biosynthesis UDP-glucose lipid carrier transferase